MASIEGSADAARRGAAWRSLLRILAGALILLIPTAINRGPFLYRDTVTYIRGAEMGAVKVLGERFQLPDPVPATSPDAGPSAGLTSVNQGVFIAGRSVYYGALLYAAILAGSLLLAVAAQALAVSFTIHTFFKAVRPIGTPGFLALLAGLSLATPLGLYTGLAMPDVFAGLAILIVATFACAFPALARGERLALFAILTFAMLAHSSHLVLGIGVSAIGVLVAARYLRDARWSMPALLVVAAVLLGVAGERAFTHVATRVLGSPPLRLPHLSAHLVEMGPGTAYLNRHCGTPAFAICADRAKFPVYWESFLFSAAPREGVFALADPARKRRISDEQVRFAAAVWRDQPLAVTGGFARSFAEQAVRFRTQEFYYAPDVMEAFATRLPAAEYRRVLRTRAAGQGAWDTALTVSTYLLTIAGILVAVIALVRVRPASAEQRRVIAAAVTVLAGVLINALVCGVLASPYDRFQARVIWLVPLVAAALWAMLRKARV